MCLKGSWKHIVCCQPASQGQRSAISSNQYFPLLSGDPPSPTVSTSGLHGKKRSEEKALRSLYVQVKVALPQRKNTLLQKKFCIQIFNLKQTTFFCSKIYSRFKFTPS